MDMMTRPAIARTQIYEPLKEAMQKLLQWLKEQAGRHRNNEVVYSGPQVGDANSSLQIQHRSPAHSPDNEALWGASCTDHCLVYLKDVLMFICKVLCCAGSSDAAHAGGGGAGAGARGGSVEVLRAGAPEREQGQI